MKVQYTKREVIERKLLAAIERSGTVAVLLSEQDCDALLWVLDHSSTPLFSERLANLREGIQRLKDGAF